MKKVTTLFLDSYHEFKKVRTITTASMFAAIGVILGAYTIQVGNYLKIGFSGIANQFVYYLFGPVVGCFYGGALDILKYLVKPTGAFFPGWTLSAMAAGVIYGCFFYKKPLSLVRVFVAELTVSIICNMLLGTLWLQIMYGKAFFAILPARVIKNLAMWPVNSLLFYSLTWMMEHTGVFQVIRHADAAMGLLLDIY